MTLEINLCAELDSRAADPDTHDTDLDLNPREKKMDSTCKNE